MTLRSIFFSKIGTTYVLQLQIACIIQLSHWQNKLRCHCDIYATLLATLEIVPNKVLYLLLASFFASSGQLTLSVTVQSADVSFGQLVLRRMPTKLQAHKCN